MQIQDKVALVTGGGSGLGEATAYQLAQAGAKVIVLDKNAQAAKRVATLIHGYPIAADVSQAPEIETLFQNLFAIFSRPLSILINCAGIAPAHRLYAKDETASLEAFKEVINVNLVGTFNLMRLAAAHFSQQKTLEEERGVIINTASIAAFEGQIGQTAYSASKGAIVAMTLPAARELAPLGVRVMTIAPGLMDTPLVKDFSEKVKITLRQQTLFPKRWGTPDEFAQLVVHIIVNPLLNGEVIRLDGGVRLP